LRAYLFAKQKEKVAKQALRAYLFAKQKEKVAE
jgi:hypothetical protein